MNKQHRKWIADTIDTYNEIVPKLQEILADLESIRDEEQEYLDNMPESMQQGEKGEMAAEAISSLEEAKDALESLLDAEIEGLMDTAAQ